MAENWENNSNKIKELVKDLEHNYLKPNCSVTSPDYIIVIVGFVAH